MLKSAAPLPRILRAATASRRAHTDAPSTPLSAVLRSQIRFSGPLTVADYMRHSLTHPTHGYYTARQHVFGARGDFVTSPLVSPVFSEMLAVFVAHFAASIPNYRLVELGPGDGTLQRSLLPALSALGAPPASLSMVDASAALRERQRDAVPPGQAVDWYDGVDDMLAALDTQDENMNKQGLPVQPTVFIAHEFLDALPVHVFRRVETDRWREVLVDVDPSSREGALRLVLSRVPTPALSLLPHAAPASSEDVIEVAPAALSVSRSLASRVVRDGGLALLVDYGAMHRRGMTVRSIARHAQGHVLDAPGTVDVTADVDFGAVARVVAQTDGAHFVGTTSQRLFLLRLGIAQRMRVLAANLVRSPPKGGPQDELDAKLQGLQHDYDRLVGLAPGQMGDVYQVGVICRDSAQSLTGFSVEE